MVGCGCLKMSKFENKPKTITDTMKIDKNTGNWIVLFIF